MSMAMLYMMKILKKSNNGYNGHSGEFLSDFREKKIKKF